ncbi:MAG: hypothetical protein M9962_07565 [Oligoflexia bacterium]|nr:hypothetical protein [Oligoflexia bacterium]
MKILIITVIMLLNANAWALPVLNKNTPGAEDVTVFPDHADPNLFYLAPKAYVISKNDAGIPNFSYFEYRVKGVRHGFIQTTITAKFDTAQLEEAKNRIRAIFPSAQFTALAFDSSSVEFSDTLKPLIVANDCNHQAGLVGDEQVCSFEISRKGINVFRPMLKKGITITTQIAFSISGVKQQADGTYINHTNSYNVAGRIGDKELANYPELFIDEYGKVIKAEFNEEF